MYKYILYILHINCVIKLHKSAKLVELFSYL